MKIIKIPKASTNSGYSPTKKLAEAFDSDEETEKANTVALNPEPMDDLIVPLDDIETDEEVNKAI